MVVVLVKNALGFQSHLSWTEQGLKLEVQFTKAWDWETLESVQKNVIISVWCFNSLWFIVMLEYFSVEGPGYSQQVRTMVQHGGSWIQSGSTLILLLQ